MNQINVHVTQLINDALLICLPTWDNTCSDNYTCVYITCMYIFIYVGTLLLWNALKFEVLKLDSGMKLVM